MSDATPDPDAASDRGAALWCRTTGPDGTRAVASAVAELVRAGDVVSLSGELGAGKTCFVQGAAAGLGVTARVTSPTFVLVRVLEGGRLPVVHTDVYRLDRLRDVDDLGDEVLAPDVVTFVEWGDAIAALLPDDRLEVELTMADPDDVTGDRIIALRGLGTWRERLERLRPALAACAHDPGAAPC